jgi:hypothetical protein
MSHRYLRLSVSVFLVAALAFAIGCQPADRCYFCVVPQTLPNGESTAAARERLETWFCQQAGGFTCWPALHGGWMAGDRRVDEDNAGYLVVAGPGLGPQVDARIRDEFRQGEAFVISWPVSRQPPPTGRGP